MIKNLKTTVHDLPGNGYVCPNCGKPYTPVEYYTGVAVSSTSSRVDYNTVQTVTSYTNVNRHMGGICRFCDVSNQKSMIPLMIGVSILGMIILTIGMFLARGIIPMDRMRFGGLEVILTIIGGGALIVGVIYIIIAATASATRFIKPNELYTRFIGKLLTEKQMRTGVVYLSPDTVSKMTTRRW